MLAMIITANLTQKIKFVKKKKCYKYRMKRDLKPFACSKVQKKCKSLLLLFKIITAI